MTICEMSREKVIHRYHHDAVFHALVHVVEPGGYTDEHGVAHEGPTIGGAQRVQRFLEAADALGFELVPKDAQTGRGGK